MRGNFQRALKYDLDLVRFFLWPFQAYARLGGQRWCQCIFEGNPVDEGTTGRSTDTPVHLRKNRMEGMATHSSILAWIISTDRGAWQTTARRVAQSRTRLKCTHTSDPDQHLKY